MTKNNKKILSVITLNVKGLLDHKKRYSTFLALRSYSADIILLQETNITPSFSSFVQSQWLLPSFWNYYRAILINNKNITLQNLDEFFDGRHQVLNFSLNGLSFTINNIYSPPHRPERLSFWSKISIPLNSEHINLVGGDFNCVLNPKRDRESAAHFRSDPSADIIRQKLSGFVDTYSPSLNYPLHTFLMNTQAGPLLSRLDYVFIDSLCSHFQTNTSTFFTNSDHLALKAELFLPPSPSVPKFRFGSFRFGSVQ
jgi:endonuclease/exonuclease/phosphatase family metal-dependent hydrolase